MSERTYSTVYLGGDGDAVPCCSDCGALVADLRQHDAWHDATPGGDRRQEEAK